MGAAAEFSVFQPSLEDERLNGYMDDWVIYTTAGEAGMFAPGRSPGFINGGSVESCEELFGGVDLRRCKAIQTIVYDEMLPSEKDAVSHRYLGTRFAGPLIAYPELLRRARQTIIRGLRLRHLFVE